MFLPQTLIDGSVFAQSPALYAFELAQQMYLKENKNLVKPQEESTVAEMVMVSIGTGVVKQSPGLKKTKSKVKLRWIKSIIGLMKNGSAKRVDTRLKKIFNTEQKDDQYFRLSPKLYHASPDLDNVTPQNLKALNQDGLQFIEENYNMLEQLVDKLIR